MDSISSGELLRMITKVASMSSENIAILAAAVVLGVIICFLGIKVMKFISAFIGFFIGVGVGAAIGAIAEITGFTYLILVFGCAILIAVLSFFVFRISVFIFSFFVFFASIIVVIGSTSSMVYVIAAAVGLVLGIISMIFMEPMIVVVTAIWGGLCAGDGIAQIAGLSNSATMGFVIGGALAIVGMLIQYFLFVRKPGKKSKRRSKDDEVQKDEPQNEEENLYDDFE